MPQNQCLLADCNVRFPDRTRPRARIRASSDDEAVVISANEMESAQPETTNGRVSAPAVKLNRSKALLRFDLWCERIAAK